MRAAGIARAAAPPRRNGLTDMSEPAGLDAALAEELARLKVQSLYRARRVLDGPQGPAITVGGKRFLSFCSNDYLGLANDPRLARAFKRGIDDYGSGSGAAHLITGHMRAHHQLEEELAAFVQRPRALLFSTGYMANLGVAGALLERGDAVYEDRLNHASLLDAGLLSGARFQRYAHADTDSLAAKLAGGGARRRLVLTDGVFSMDGDLAPLPALAQACRARRAWLMVDDAHGLGVLGENGRGTLEHFGLTSADAPILMGTLGKALGTFGAFVAGSEALIETLIQKARTYIYTTALPPAVTEATRAAVRIVQEEPERRVRLRALIERFRAGAAQLDIPLLDSQTAIQPLPVGAAARAVNLSDALRDKGFLVPAIRPPTVPQGTARLRITLSAAHSEQDADRLLEVLNKMWNKK